jgi:subtilisin-like proprotein convertase family protein
MGETEARERRLSQNESGYGALRDIVRLWLDIYFLMHSMLIFLVRLLLIMLGSVVVAAPAAAQSTRTSTNTSSGIVSSLGTSCVFPLVRNFSVSSNFIVGDVDLGVYMTHSYRGDINITLQSPSGTRRLLVSGSSTASGNNFNVRLNDSGTQVVNTDSNTGTHSTTVPPPYQNNFIPNNSLSIFNGQTSSGTWRLEICDTAFLQDGNFLRADLYLTPATNASGTGATFIVSSTADTGTATLRQAVIDANATPTEADTIAFSISGAGPHTITLASALPDITDTGVLIDGTTQSGTQCRDLWLGNGHDLRINVRGGSAFDGFRPAGSNQTVTGLSISGFANGVNLLSTSNTATVQCNYLGVLANGTSNGNVGRGANISGASARIGGLTAGQGNVISANGIAGIVTNSGSTDTSIQNNFIGTDAAGISARANSTGINHFNGSATWRDITRNLISGNSASAIALETDDIITGSSGDVVIAGNYIGINRTGTAGIANVGDGIRFSAGSISNVRIGGTALSDRNIISGNSSSGVSLTGVNRITFLNNYIGLSSNGLAVVPNGGTGINNNGSSFITVGNGSADGRNVIAGNRERAMINVGAFSNITVSGNYIGTDFTGNVGVANAGSLPGGGADAMVFSSSTNSASNIVVTGNVIGAFSGSLLDFWQTNVTNVTIQGNNLGIGANGTTVLTPATTEAQIFLNGPDASQRAHNNFLIGGSGNGQGNLIANGGNIGIVVNSTGTDIRVTGNTIRNFTNSGVALVGTSKVAIYSNSISGNGGLGIDLGTTGVTANDAGDGDSGPNDHLNFPTITAVNVRGANQLQYNFTLDVPAAASGYRVEFFANVAADPTGFGEGERYLGYVDIVHAGGIQTFNGTLTTLQPIGIGDIISATATRRTAAGAWDITSEFSAVATAAGTAQLAVTINSEVFDPQPGSFFATPGDDMLLTTTVSNVGTGSTDADSIFAVIAINLNHAFLNAATPAFGGVVGFSTSAPALTFTPGADLRFSNDTSPPASLAQCTYTPAAGYDSQVRYVCINPKGTLPNGVPNGQLYVQLRARIN